MYLSFSIDISLVLQQKLHQFDVPIVAGYVQRGVAHLKDKIRSQTAVSTAPGPSGLGMLNCMGQPQQLKDGVCRSSSQVFFTPTMANALLYPRCCVHCDSVFHQNVSNWYMSLLGHEMERSQATLQKEHVTCTGEVLQLDQQREQVGL